MQASFKVTLNETEKFAKVWNYNGIVVPLDDIALNFAKDFSNVVLRNFIEMCQKDAAQRRELEKKKQIIIEGV